MRPWTAIIPRQRVRTQSPIELPWPPPCGSGDARRACGRSPPHPRWPPGSRGRDRCASQAAQRVCAIAAGARAIQLQIPIPSDPPTEGRAAPRRGAWPRSGSQRPSRHVPGHSAQLGVRADRAGEAATVGRIPGSHDHRGRPARRDSSVDCMASGSAAGTRQARAQAPASEPTAPKPPSECRWSLSAPRVEPSAADRAAGGERGHALAA